MIITKIVVVGAPTEESRGDLVWDACRVDGDYAIRNLKITIRKWLHDGHPLEVYVNGGYSIYPVVVYDEDGHMIGVSAGLLGAVKDDD